jgi:hypothetical protein
MSKLQEFMDQVNEIDRVILEYEELDAGHNIDE